MSIARLDALGFSRSYIESSPSSSSYFKREDDRSVDPLTEGWDPRDLERLKLLYLSLALAIMGGSQFRLGDLEGGDLLLCFVLGLVLSFNLLERLSDPLERSFLLSGLLIDKFWSFLPRLFFYVCRILPACFDKRDYGLPLIEVANIESRASDAFLNLSF